MSVGFCAIVLGIAALVSALGWLPGWVRTVAALGIAAMPTAVAAQIARTASENDTKFLSVVGPGMLLMLAGGVVIGLARTPGRSR
jgi:Trk-type K+ transport system membrane component